MHSKLGMARAPANLSGFFQIFMDEDPLIAGSTGAGFTIEKGVDVQTKKSEHGIKIRLNGMAARIPPVLSVIETLGITKVDPGLEVEIKSEVPIGCGFGFSGAASLSVGLAINELFELNRTYLEIGQIAHQAEVVNRTGLGDVMGQTSGGFNIGIKPGAPGIGVAESIDVGDPYIEWVVFNEIKTEEIIDDSRSKEIDKYGGMALKELLKRPTFENFMLESKKFAIRTGLASEKVMDAIEAVESAGGMASMIMLGDAVFAYRSEDALEEFGDVGRAKISHESARVIQYHPR